MERKDAAKHHKLTKVKRTMIFTPNKEHQGWLTENVLTRYKPGLIQNRKKNELDKQKQTFLNKLKGEENNKNIETNSKQDKMKT